VIRPTLDDCFFWACNAMSECVPAVALVPGELGNVPALQGWATDALASDGRGVFVASCGEFSGGAGATTELALARAREAISWWGHLPDWPAFVDVERIDERVELLPSRTYPPTTVRARVEVSRGRVPWSQLDDVAKSALSRRAGPDYQIRADSYRLVTRPEPDRLSVRYVATAMAYPDQHQLSGRIADAIAHQTVADARRQLVEVFGATHVSIDMKGNDGRLPNRDEIRVRISSP
jgi:hypothetical protein